MGEINKKDALLGTPPAGSAPGGGCEHGDDIVAGDRSVEGVPVQQFAVQEKFREVVKFALGVEDQLLKARKANLDGFDARSHGAGVDLDPAFAFGGDPVAAGNVNLGHGNPLSFELRNL
jgi:hypothetical protein